MGLLRGLSTMLIALALSACGLLEFPVQLPAVPPNIDEVRVVARVQCTQEWQGSGDICRVIDDPQEIAAIRGFLDSRLDGWSTPMAGAPIHPVKLFMYADGKLVESVGLSAHSIERRTFLSRSIASAEVDEMLRLISLDRSYLRFRIDDPVPE